MATPRLSSSRPSRRELLAAGSAAFLLPLPATTAAADSEGTHVLPTPTLYGGLRQVQREGQIGGAWYHADANTAGLDFAIEPGTLARYRYLTADFLLDGSTVVVWILSLHEQQTGNVFHFRFSGLNQCGFRLRMSLDVVDQNRWRLEREGAWLKPICSGDRVQLDTIHRITLQVERKGDAPALWEMKPLAAAPSAPEKLSKPHLPAGALLDELGQSRIHHWPGKTKGLEECIARIRQQVEEAPKRTWPDSFTRWGGWKARKLRDGARFFSKHHDGKRWWLTDPDGYAFWSAGLDCVRVDCTSAINGLESALTWLPPKDGIFADAYTDVQRNGFSYLAANWIRACGPKAWRDQWAAAALGELKRLRFNTVGNWSEWEHAASAEFPYVRPLAFRPSRVPLIYRDFPDVFHPRFADDAEDYAQELGSTRDDPALIGYFLMNEPTWGFSEELPAVGMMFNSAECVSRQEFARTLGAKYADSASLAQSWEMPVTLEQIAKGQWTQPFSTSARQDLEAFSTRMVERYFRNLSEACKRVDSNHLNLGMRWAGVPPSWALAGMRYFDVYSINCYREKVPREFTDEIQRLLNVPTIVGEWHFGALDAGLPASGIGHVRNQQDRGRAYRVYVEDAMANPNCVGTHWFTLYDQSAIGRFDGENYNIGFLDVCNRPYAEIGKAAITAHERMYALAEGSAEAYADAPPYLPKLFV